MNWLSCCVDDSDDDREVSRKRTVRQAASKAVSKQREILLGDGGSEDEEHEDQEESYMDRTYSCTVAATCALTNSLLCMCVNFMSHISVCSWWVWQWWRLHGGGWWWQRLRSLQEEKQQEGDSTGAAGEEGEEKSKTQTKGHRWGVWLFCSCSARLPFYKKYILYENNWIWICISLPQNYQTTSNSAARHSHILVAPHHCFAKKLLVFIVSPDETSAKCVCVPFLWSVFTK